MQFTSYAFTHELMASFMPGIVLSAGLKLDKKQSSFSNNAYCGKHNMQKHLENSTSVGEIWPTHFSSNTTSKVFRIFFCCLSLWTLKN